MEYRFEHFNRQLLMEDMAFAAGPTPGEPFPDFDLATSEGTRVRRSEYLGKPLLVTIGSFTCPMTADSGDILKRLYREFGDKVTFLTLYVREAHPGERYPQPSTFEQKREHARAYKTRDVSRGRSRWTTWTDHCIVVWIRSRMPSTSSIRMAWSHFVPCGRMTNVLCVTP